MKRLILCTFCTSLFLISMSAISSDNFLPSPSLHRSASTDPFEPKFIPTEKPKSSGNSWFVGVGAGYDWTSFTDSSSSVLMNTSGNSPDLFVLSQATQSSAAEELYVGYRFKIHSSKNYAPYASLQLDYEHVNQINPNGTRTALYQAPPILSINYSAYSYDVSRNSLFLLGKLNLFEEHSIMPFLEGGIGLAINSFSGFQDNSQDFQIPVFPDKTEYNFGSTVGAGVDWAATQNILLSFAYRYVWWGDVNSGSVNTNFTGMELPASVHLSNSLTSQQVLGTLTYLFDKG